MKVSWSEDDSAVGVLSLEWDRCTIQEMTGSKTLSDYYKTKSGVSESIKRRVVAFSCPSFGFRWGQTKNCHQHESKRSSQALTRHCSKDIGTYCTRLVGKNLLRVRSEQEQVERIAVRPSLLGQA